MLKLTRLGLFILLLLVCGRLAADSVGLTSIGASRTFFSSGLLVATGPFTASTTGTVSKIWFYCGDIVTGSQSVTMAIYVGNTSNPITLLAQTTGGSHCALSSGAWDSDTDIAGTSITSGSTYWFAVQATANIPGAAYDSAPTRGRFVANTYSAGALPNPFPASPTVFNVDVSMYVEYSATPTSGGAATSPTDTSGSGPLILGIRRHR